MPRLSQKQSTVIERNYTHLGLSYGDEQVLVRLPFVDMLPDHCSDIVGLIFDYLRSENDRAKDKYREEMKQLINKYREAANKIQ